MAGGLYQYCQITALFFIIFIHGYDGSAAADVYKNDNINPPRLVEPLQTDSPAVERFYPEVLLKSYQYLKNRGAIQTEHEQLTSSLFTQQAVGKSVYDVLRTSILTQNKGQKYKTSADCTSDLVRTLEAVTEQKTWALRIVDASGKIGSGILEGNTRWWGSYDECINTVATSLTPQNVTKRIFGTKFFLASIGSGVTAFQLGVCVPESCNSSNVNALVSSVLAMLSLGNTTVNSEEKMPTFPLDAPAIGVIILLSFLLIVMLIGTAYDVFIYQPILEHEKAQEARVNSTKNSGTSTPTTEGTSVLTATEYTPLLATKAGTPMTSSKDIGIVPKILLSLSLFTNAKKLLNTDVTSNATLSNIHGIRFFSMTWVILGHAYFFDMAMIQIFWKIVKSFSLWSNGSKITSTYQSSSSLSSIHGVRFFSMCWVVSGHTLFFLLILITQNIGQFPELLKRFSFQAVVNATVSVDTFFLLSGLLVSYLTLRELKERGGPKNFNWFLYYFHRFWRLTPAYMLVLGAYTALYKYFGNGPTWPGDVPEPYCKDNWWTNLLYINNIVKPSDGCMMWSWYLANDMQFHILSPLFIIPLYLHFYAGLAVVLGTLLISLIVSGVLSVVNAFPPSTPAILYYLDKMVSYFQDYYLVPWTRIGPYLVGILIGYALYYTDRKVKIPKWLVVTGWMLSAACNLAVLYGLYDQANGTPIDPSLAAFYNAVHRPVWACGVGWVIFACVTGYGGPVNRLLSWPAIIPFSRLTYMAYLIHPIVMEWYYQSRRTPIYLDDSTVIYLFLGHLVVSYGVAFVLSLAFEAPMMALEKVIFKRK